MYTGTKIVTTQLSSSSSVGNNYNQGAKNVNQPTNNAPVSGAASSTYRKFLHRRVNTEIDEHSNNFNYGQGHQHTNSNLGTNTKYYPYQYPHQNPNNLNNKNSGGLDQNYKKDYSKNRFQGYINNSGGSINNNPYSSGNIGNNIISSNLATNGIANSINSGQIGGSNSNIQSNNKQTTSSALYKNYKLTSKNNGIISKYIKTEPDIEEFPTQSNRNRNTNPINVKMNPSSNSNPTRNTQIYNNKYEIQGVAGKGTFGVVYYGKIISTGQKIAVKKVLQDKKYKNRELEILKEVKHSNILVMKDYFISNEGTQQYLNVIMDYYSDNLYQVIKKKQMTPLMIKLYTYQILRGLHYLSSLSISHRDIKPQNILVDRNTNKVVICDFGSAKKLVKGEPNIAYICSRCYRAPQLIFGATQYTSQIDMWSVGCVIVQMINGQAPFLGDSQIDQLLEIIKILGTPLKADIQQMNPKYDLKQHKKFPNIKPVPWRKILKTEDAQLVDLVTKILEYSPKKRLSAADALKHAYFEQLKLLNQNNQKDIQYCKKMRVKQIPQLFDYSPEQIMSFGVEGQSHIKSPKKQSKDNEKNIDKRLNLPVFSHQIELPNKLAKQRQRQRQRQKQKQKQKQKQVQKSSRMQSGNIIQNPGIKSNKDFRGFSGNRQQKTQQIHSNLNIEEDSVKIQKNVHTSINNNLNTHNNGTGPTMGTGSNTQSGSRIQRRIPTSGNFPFSAGIVHLSSTGPSLGTNGSQNIGKITSNRFQYR